MKYKIIIIFLFLTINSYSQTNPTKNIRRIDYKGKELTSEEIIKFFNTEMQHFETIMSDTLVKIINAKNIKQYKTNNSLINLTDLNEYNIENKIFTPFKKGKISVNNFLTIYDTLNSTLKKVMLFYLYRDYVPSLKNNKPALNKIIKYDEKYNKGHYSFFIKCTQQYEGYLKQIYDTLQSDYTFKKRYPNIGFLLSRYAVANDNKSTLNLLEYSIKKLKYNSKINFAIGNFLGVFEYLTLYGNKETKAKTKLLFFEYLKKADLSEMGRNRKLFPDEISQNYKDLINSKLKYLDTISDINIKNKEIKKFQENYLNHYARNFGTRSLPYLTPLLIIPNKFIKFENGDTINYRITDYKTSLTVNRALIAIKELVTYNNLSQNDKQKLLNLLLF